MFPVIIVLLAICLFTFLHQQAYLPSVENTLLGQIGLHTVKAGSYRTLHHSYWKDPLRYTDGYECLVLQLEEHARGKLQMAMAESTLWNSECIAIDDIGAILSRPVSDAVLDQLADLAVSGLSGSWASVLSNEKHKEQTVAIYDDRDGMLLVYRAHHLDGL